MIRFVLCEVYVGEVVAICGILIGLALMADCFYAWLGPLPGVHRR